MDSVIGIASCWGSFLLGPLRAKQGNSTSAFAIKDSGILYMFFVNP
jgi:hypothetical protein